MKPCILFIDDEINILDSLRLSLRSKRNDWDMIFTTKFSEVILTIKERKVDVAICDFMMPVTNGIEVLEAVSFHSPGTMRIMLSGHVSDKASYAAIDIAHQFLSKPCQTKNIIKTIEKCIRLRDTICNKHILKILTQLNSLPVMKSVLGELLLSFQNENITVNEITQTIEKDPGMTASILRLVNSSFFGLSTRVYSACHAVNLIGVDALKTLAISSELFRCVNCKQLKNYSIDLLWEHCARVSLYAKTISEIEGWEPDAKNKIMLSGMLHDIGKLILASTMPTKYQQVIDLVSSNEYKDICSSETAIFNVNHAEVGACLVNMWGFDDDIVDYILRHHDATVVRSVETNTAINLSNKLDHEWVHLRDTVNGSDKLKEFLQTKEYVCKIKELFSTTS